MLAWSTVNKPRQKKLGNKGGVRTRARNRKGRPPLPSILLCNSRSLGNKFDGVTVSVKFLHEFQEACLLCFTKTWFDDTAQDSSLQLDGFTGPFRHDRGVSDTSKTVGGGVRFYASERWCSDIKICDQESVGLLM